MFLGREEISLEIPPSPLWDGRVSWATKIGLNTNMCYVHSSSTTGAYLPMCKPSLPLGQCRVFWTNFPYAFRIWQPICIAVTQVFVSTFLTGVAHVCRQNALLHAVCYYFSVCNRFSVFSFAVVPSPFVKFFCRLFVVFLAHAHWWIASNSGAGGA